MALTTLHTPNGEDAKMFVTIYLDALEAREAVNREEVIQMLGEIDPRFIEEIIVGRIEFSTEQFNPNGYLYTGREINKEIKDKGMTGELIIKRGKITQYET